MDLHIFSVDSFYNKAFVEFLDRNFHCDDVKFVAIWKKGSVNFPLPEREDIFYMPEWLPFQRKPIYGLIDKAERVILHSFSLRCLKIIAGYPGEKKFMFIPWGGEMVPYIFRRSLDRMDGPTRKVLYGYKGLGNAMYTIARNAYDDMFYSLCRQEMRRAVGKISHVLNTSDYEVHALNRMFKSNIIVQPFLYYNPVNLGFLDEARDGRLLKNPSYQFKRRFQRVVMVNHCASPYNNHISLIDALAKIGGDDIGVVCPLSYGTAHCKKMVTKYGMEKLGRRFCPIHEYLPPEQYAAVLGQVDVMLINCFYSGAFANIAACLYLGGKVMVNARNKQRITGLERNGLPAELINLDDPSAKWTKGLFTDYSADEKANIRKSILGMVSEKKVVEMFATMLKSTEA